MTAIQRHRRTAIWRSSLCAILFYTTLTVGPAIGGLITG